jgi:tetratricopeptide (TPR) repeat protein
VRLDFEDYWTSEQALFLDQYARALREAGDPDKAREIYEKITLLTTGRRDDGDIYARAYYWLGKIAEEKGEGRVARGNYRKFLALWDSADPGLPEVEDARARLGRF